MDRSNMPYENDLHSPGIPGWPSVAIPWLAIHVFSFSSGMRAGGADIDMPAVWPWYWSGLCRRWGFACCTIVSPSACIWEDGGNFFRAVKKMYPMGLGSYILYVPVGRGYFWGYSKYVPTVRWIPQLFRVKRFEANDLES